MVIEMSLVLQIRLLPLQVGRQPLAEVFLRALKISLVWFNYDHCLHFMTFSEVSFLLIVLEDRCFIYWPPRMTFMRLPG